MPNHLNVPLAVHPCMQSQWMVTGSYTGSIMHMGMYFFLGGGFVNFILFILLSCLYHVSLSL